MTASETTIRPLRCPTSRLAIICDMRIMASRRGSGLATTICCKGKAPPGEEAVRGSQWLPPAIGRTCLVNPTLAQTIEFYLEAQSKRKIKGIPLSKKTVQASRNEQANRCGAGSNHRNEEHRQEAMNHLRRDVHEHAHKAKRPDAARDTAKAMQGFLGHADIVQSRQPKTRVIQAALVLWRRYDAHRRDMCALAPFHF